MRSETGEARSLTAIDAAKEALESFIKTPGNVLQNLRMHLTQQRVLLFSRGQRFDLLKAAYVRFVGFPSLFAFF
jgi:hypothetical protein